jgi:hypothetical protein
LKTSIRNMKILNFKLKPKEGIYKLSEAIKFPLGTIFRVVKRYTDSIDLVKEPGYIVELCKQYVGTSEEKLTFRVIFKNGRYCYNDDEYWRPFKEIDGIQEYKFLVLNKILEDFKNI